MKKKGSVIIFALVISAPCFGQPVFGLDPSFGSGGKVISSPGTLDDFGHSSVIQSDGKIIFVGTTRQGTDYDFVLMRLESDGSPDVTFGVNGFVITDFNGFDDGANDVVIQPDGKIVVGGYSSTAMGADFAAARYNADGTLDNTFSGNGKVSVDFDDDWDYGLSLVLQTDGKIVLGGYRYEINTDYDFALARFNSDGNLDNTYSGDGKTTTDFGFMTDYISEIILQPDGKIVAAGFGMSDVTYFEDFCLARYNVSGSLDASFGVGGKVMTEVAEYSDECWAMALQPDGKILVGGFSDTSPDAKMSVLRYHPDGTLDASFDGDGIALLTVMGLAPAVQSIYVRSDNKILLSGTVLNGSSGDFFLVQLNEDGTFDTSFDDDGIYTCSLGSGDDVAVDIDVQTDGKILLSGSSEAGSGDDMVIARFMYGNAMTEENSSVMVHVFPNPANEIVNIYFDAIQSGVSVKIENLQGEIIFNTDFQNTSQVNLSVSDFAAGIYFITVSSGSELKKVKVIKS